MGSEYPWSQRLGHSGPQALRYFESETVKWERNCRKIFDCKEFSLYKSTKITSCGSSDRATAYFERVGFDLVAYSPIGFDISKYILNFTDDLTRMNFYIS